MAYYGRGDSILTHLARENFGEMGASQSDGKAGGGMPAYAPTPSQGNGTPYGLPLPTNASQQQIYGPPPPSAQPYQGFAPAPMAYPPQAAPVREVEVAPLKKSPSTKTWIGLAILVFFLLMSIGLVVYLCRKKKNRKGGKDSLDFTQDDEDEDEEGSAQDRRRGPGNRGIGRPIPRGGGGPAGGGRGRPTPAQIHRERLLRSTHGDSRVRDMSGRSDRLAPEPGMEDRYPEADWRDGRGYPREQPPQSQPDGSYKLPEGVQIPIPEGMGRLDEPIGAPPPPPPLEPMGVAAGGSSTLPSPISNDPAPTTNMPNDDPFARPV